MFSRIMRLLRDMRGLYEGRRTVISLLVSLALLSTTVSASAEPSQDFTIPALVQPWEESLQYIKPKSSPEEQAAAVKALAQRLLPDRASEFSFSVDPSIGPQGKDTFQVMSPGVNVSVDIVGTSGVAAAWGLLHYLKYSCNAHVSWEADQLSLPQPLPLAKINVTSNDRFRYYQNVCTVSYSMAWWKWSRWEREIDWMALNGINMPLAFTGQEAIWQRVYTKLGVTQEELDGHFVGPAFLAWGRMGNILGWGGPLPQSWHDETMVLQHQILQRMRQLGMTPVLPAFAGHVPAGLARVYPDANITRLGGWSHFNCTYSCTYLLDPSDSLFKLVGSEFIKELTSEFGTDHLYNCDTFNEMIPQSRDPAYLSSIGASVYGAMTAADPDAIWIMQGWIFYKDPVFWNTRRSKALLKSVPIGRMLVLDLASEIVPQYSRLESYFGQPFIFCMLHDYGGVDGFFGNVDLLLNNMMEARNFPNVTLVGTGLTPEGINQNYVMYDLMNELAWRTEMPNVTDWAMSYAVRRYNSYDSRLGEAWQLLMHSIYNCKIFLRYHGKNVVIMQRPHIKPRHLIWYSIDDVIKAWDLFIEVIEDSLRMEKNKDPRMGTEGNQMRISEDDYSKEEDIEEEDLPLIEDIEVNLSEEYYLGSRPKESVEMEEKVEKEGKSEEEKQQLPAYQPPSLLPPTPRLPFPASSSSSSSLSSSSLEASVGNLRKQPFINSGDAAQLVLPSNSPRRNESFGRDPMNRMTRRAETPGNGSLNEENKDALISHSHRGDTALFKQGSHDNVHGHSLAKRKTMEGSFEMHRKDDYQDYRRSKVTLPLTQQPTFLHDIVDITRQVLQILGGQVALSMVDYYHNGDKFGVQVDSNNIQGILKDFDDILATSPDFLLGTWTASAATWATNEQERELYVYNALNQVTLWGPDGEILDYAIKQWSGLISNYIRPRWEMFANKLVNSLDEGIPFDKEAFEKDVFAQVEEPLSKDVNASYPSVPTGDTITTALLLHGKYRGFFNETLMNNNSSERRTQQSQLPPVAHNDLDAILKKKKKVKGTVSKSTNPAMKKRNPELKINTVFNQDTKTMDKLVLKILSRSSGNSIWNLVQDGL